MFKSHILTGHLMHSRRTTEVQNHFTYPVYSLLIHLDELPHLQQRLTLFGYNRFNAFSVYDKDHFDDHPGNIKEKLFAYLERQGQTRPTGDVYMLTNPRVFGYVFNPVSFFYCYHDTGELDFVIAEVNNTNGERYPYLLTDAVAVPVTEKEASRDMRRYGVKKRFYVSPFIPTEDVQYELSFTPVANYMIANIDEFRHGQKFFQARLWGNLQALSNRSLLSIGLRYPFMTLQVIAYIHWQAIKVYRQGVSPYPKPSTPPPY